MRKIRIFALIIAVFLAFSSVSFAAEANTKVSASTKKINKTRKYAYGEITNYVKYVKLSGSSKTIKKINKTLKNEAKQYLWSESHMDQLEDLYGSQFERQSDYPPVVSQTTVEKVGFNKGNVISVSLTTEAVENTMSGNSAYGLNYNLKTGKKLKLSDVLPEKYDPTTKAGYKRLRKYIYTKVKKDMSENAAEWFSAWCTQKYLKDTAFYITKSGRIVLCFNNMVFGGNGGRTSQVTVMKTKL